MGHYCRICARTRANETFSGKGHKSHICKDCARMPKADRQGIEQQDEIFGFLRQSRISARNMTRLGTLAISDNARTAELAGLVLEVAEATPFKKRRLKILARNRSDLLDALENTGLIQAHGG